MNESKKPIFTEEHWSKHKESARKEHDLLRSTFQVISPAHTLSDVGTIMEVYDQFLGSSSSENFNHFLVAYFVPASKTQAMLKVFSRNDLSDIRKVFGEPEHSDEADDSEDDWGLHYPAVDFTVQARVQPILLEVILIFITITQDSSFQDCIDQILCRLVPVGDSSEVLYRFIQARKQHCCADAIVHLLKWCGDHVEYLHGNIDELPKGEEQRLRWAEVVLDQIEREKQPPTTDFHRVHLDCKSRKLFVTKRSGGEAAPIKIGANVLPLLAKLIYEDSRRGDGKKASVQVSASNIQKWAEHNAVLCWNHTTYKGIYKFVVFLSKKRSAINFKVANAIWENAGKRSGKQVHLPQGYQLIRYNPDCKRFYINTVVRSSVDGFLDAYPTDIPIDREV
ncbi:hypothetical protein WDW86_05700 [Bdellovibrionota bacterium FG-2]